MAASKKNISKSVRISEEVYAYIDKAPGKGFNEKFENIILEAKQTEAERKKRLAGLEKQIHDAQLRLMKLLQQDRELQQFSRSFTRMQHMLDDLKETLQRVSDPETEK